MSSAVDSRSETVPTSVLLIEDDRHIQRSINFQLSRQGYSVTCCEDGEEGLARALREPYHVVILDVMLPRLDGLSVCKQLRASNPSLPIIITSARGSDLDKITGFEFGADDYLAKPFSPAELEARIRALRRRSAAGDMRPSTRLVVGDLVLEVERREVRLGGTLVKLTPKEFDLLMLFMRNPGRVFAREAILVQIWGYSYEGYHRTVDAHVGRLRAKLMEVATNQPEYIEAVYGVGYRCRDLSEE